ncbi:MAG: Zn-dependent protease [Maribacter sp.]|jgi:Zn-dependent protease
MLVLFNFIPAFPMDGGKVFKALLALKMDRAKARSIAPNLGR